MSKPKGGDDFVRTYDFDIIGIVIISLALLFIIAVVVLLSKQSRTIEMHFLMRVIKLHLFKIYFLYKYTINKEVCLPPFVCILSTEHSRYNYIRVFRYYGFNMRKYFCVSAF